MPPALDRLRRWLSARQEQKRVMRNAFWLYVDKASRMAIALLVGLWVARHLGPQDWGSLNYAAAFIGLFAPLAAFGLDNLVLRELSERPQDDGKILGTALWIRSVATLLSLGLALAWSLLWGASATLTLVAVSSLTLLSTPWDTLDLWFQSQRRSRDSVLGRNASLWLVALFRMALVLMNAPLIAFAVAPVLEALLGALGVGIALKRARGAVPTEFDPAEFRHFLKECLPLILTGFSIMIYMRIDVVMLQSIGGALQTGVYSAAVKVSEMWYFVPMAVVGSAAPALFESHRADRSLFTARFQRLMDLSAMLGVVFAAGLALASPWVIRVLYGSRFDGAAPILAVHAWSGVFVCLGIVQGQWWNLQRLNGHFFASTLLGAVANVGLNLLWLPRLAGLGAAWATLIAYAAQSTLYPLCFARSRGTVLVQLKALAFPFRLRGILRGAGWLG